MSGSIMDQRTQKAAEIMQHVDEAIDAHVSDEKDRYRRFEERLDQIEISMAQMLELWNGAKGVLAFLRWAAAIGATIAAIMAWAKDHIKL